MEILGVGGLELVAILVIAIVVAGPKRMLQWAYILGQYVAKLRHMWKDVAVMLQKELDASGVDYKVPEQMPTRGTLTRELNKVLKPMTQPMQETANQLNAELAGLKNPAKLGASKAVEATPQPVPQLMTAEEGVVDFGAWSGNTQSAAQTE
ncbi:MAG: hypothetical protein H7Y09_08025 [Chitinophagaceae bacterium]|nr:hypothetical protein [Anaerolineae bacterium]